MNTADPIVGERRETQNEDSMEEKMNAEEEGVNGSQQPNADASNNGNVEHGKEDKKQSSKFKEVYARLGLDIGTVMMMFKGSVAPIIAIAFYQADSVCCCGVFCSCDEVMNLLTVLCR